MLVYQRVLSFQSDDRIFVPLKCFDTKSRVVLPWGPAETWYTTASGPAPPFRCFVERTERQHRDFSKKITVHI
jgi:hypothetical protein